MLNFIDKTQDMLVGVGAIAEAVVFAQEKESDVPPLQELPLMLPHLDADSGLAWSQIVSAFRSNKRSAEYRQRANLCHYLDQLGKHPESTLMQSYGHYMCEVDDKQLYDIKLTAVPVTSPTASSSLQGPKKVTAFDSTCRYYVEYDPSAVEVDELYEAVNTHLDERKISSEYFVPVDENITVKVIGIDSKLKSFSDV